MREKTDDYLFSIKELAEIMSVKECSIRRLIAQGKIKSIRIGRLHRIPAKNYREFIGLNK